MLTDEQRAAINRKNAQSSTGPRTHSGKQRSAKNSLVHGLNAQHFKNLIPPHNAVLCNQDRQLYYRVAERFLEKYQPHDPAEEQVVLRIANAEWRVDLINRVALGLWNQEILKEFKAQGSPIPEIAELLALLESAKNLASNGAVDRFIQRATKEQDRIIAAAERRLILMRKHFPSDNKGIDRRELDRERRAFNKPSDQNEPVTNPDQTQIDPNISPPTNPLEH